MKKKNVIKIGLFVGALILLITPSIALAGVRRAELSPATPEIINIVDDDNNGGSSFDSDGESITGTIEPVKSKNCHWVCTDSYPDYTCKWVCEGIN